jgi:hypothetical protein
MNTYRQMIATALFGLLASAPGVLADTSFDGNVTVASNLAAKTLSGDGTQVTNVPATTLTGRLPAAAMPTSGVWTVTGLAISNIPLLYVTGTARFTNTVSMGSSTAVGSRAFAHGTDTRAAGWSSHSEGYVTYAGNNSAHAEGAGSAALKAESHAQGGGATADGYGSHAEGYSTYAAGHVTHAEGYETYSMGNVSHAQGSFTHATGDGAHAGGRGGFTSPATNEYRIAATGVGSFAHGCVGEGPKYDNVQSTNTIAASGRAAVAMGLAPLRATGKASAALGAGSEATHDYAYVWSDGQSVTSSKTNQFTVSARGGIRLLGGPVEIAYVLPQGDLSMGSFTNGAPQ